MAACATPGEVSGIDQVRRLVRDRPSLAPGFAAVWRCLASTDMDVLQRWAELTLALSNANAGPACIAAFWQLCAPADAAALARAFAAGHAAAGICRFAGARAALACLEAQPTATRLTGPGGSGLVAWWQGLDRLAREAPRSVAPVARQAERLLQDGGPAFGDFVAAGLKATARDKRRREAFFALEDPLAHALLQQRGVEADYAASERMLTAFVGGLWGGTPRLRAGTTGATGPQRRTAITGGTIILPAGFAGVPASRVPALYRAAAAHAQAHMTVPALRLPLLSLKPLQVALIGLVEDARAEALAIRRFPGLRRLWAEWHVARPGGSTTAENLMARLARGLLDPGYADPDGFVEKGRALFAAAASRLDDPAASREIGGLLGNDLGQMRVQFNARTYAVEPAYRDDNLHLWDLPETPDDALSLTVDTARGRDNAEGGGPTQGEGAAAPRAKPAGLADRGPVIATYPEWDAVARRERPDWTTLREASPVLQPRGIEVAGEAGLRAAVARLVRSAVVGQSARQSRREDGEAIDIDAAIAAISARRAGLPPDGRIYRDRKPQGCDLATLVIMDISQSTGAIAVGGQSVLDAERVAVCALAEALEARGDRYAVRAFASAGRDDVRLIRLKDFGETLGPAVFARLAGLRPGLSTRLGAALRHAGAELAPLRTTRKMVLVLTDGEPSDIDVADPRELVEDSRRAVAGLRLRGVDAFAAVMDPQDAGSAGAIFGPHNTMPVRRLEELPAQLAGIYFRLGQR